MSEYFVIDELDYTDQIAATFVTTNGIVEGYSKASNLGLGNNTAATFPVPVNSTAIQSPCNIIISGAKQIQLGDNAQTTNTFGTILVAKKIINLEQLNETTNSMSREIKVWPQYRWRCFLCTHSCDYYKILTNHLRDLHNITEADDIRYQCSDCGRVIDEYCQFINHIRQHHHPHLKLSCDVCSRTYEQFHTLAKHRETVHADHVNLRPLVFNCDKCELTFATKDELNYHCEHHPWICWMLNPNGSLCREEFVNRNELFKHRSVHGDIQKHTCHICGLQFRSRGDFAIHFTVHANELPYNCTVCIGRFRTESELVNHLKTHTTIPYSTKKEKIKSCNKCGKKFPNNSDMSKHTKFACLRYSLSYRIPPKKNSQQPEK